VDAMVFFGDLQTIASKLITFGAYMVNVFKSIKIGVIFELKYHNAPFMIGVHCMNHHTNLVV
jgi:hypothetical protein